MLLRLGHQRALRRFGSITPPSQPLPLVDTDPATNVTTTSAVLAGRINPRGNSTTARFEYSLDSALATYTETTPQSIGSGLTTVFLTQPLAGLTPGTRYYFRMVAVTPQGLVRGSILSLDTQPSAQPQAPTVITGAASTILSDLATLNGQVNPNGQATQEWFEWGTLPNLSTFTATNQESAGSGTTPVATDVQIGGLVPESTYYFRAAASNASGIVRGSIQSFTTLPLPPTDGEQPAPAAVGGPLTPTVRTRWPLGDSPVNNVVLSYGRRSAIFYGDVNPNGSTTAVWFEYGSDPNLTTFTATPQRSLSPSSFPAFMHRHWYCNYKSDLQAGTQYYVRICASNQHGTVKGPIVSFQQRTTHPTDHRYPRFSHARFAQSDHRTVIGRSWLSWNPYWQNGTITSEVFDDEINLYAMKYDYTMNTKTKVYTWNNLHIGMPYLTQLWFVPVRDQANFEAAIAALGGDPENAYLHYASGVSVGEYTHGRETDNQGVPLVPEVIDTGGTGINYPAHVSDGIKKIENRVWGTQFKIQGYYYVNMADPFFQQYRTNLINNIFAASNHTYLWQDTHGVNVVQQYIPSGGILEHPAGRGNGNTPAPGTYWEAHRAFVADERTRVPGGRIIINQAQRWNRTEELEFAKLTGGTMTEFSNGAYRSNTGWDAALASLANNTLVQYSVAQDNQAGSLYIIKAGMTPGNYHTPQDRMLMFEYISYLSVYDPAKMELMFMEPNIETEQMPWFVVWTKGWERNVGIALGPRSLTGPGTTYTRDLEFAKLYIRQGGSDVSEATAVSHNLPAGNTWRMLHGDGTLGPFVTSFTIRKGEGLLFIKG